MSRPITLNLIVLLALWLSLGACAHDDSAQAKAVPDAQAAEPIVTAPAERPGPALPPNQANPDCWADDAANFVGKPATDATVAAAKRAAGAKGDLRVIKPGQPVTLDFRQDRLNVEVDDQNVIVKISCG